MLSYCPCWFTALCFHGIFFITVHSCYSGLPPVDIIFSCPDTITLKTVAKTLIIVNPGRFLWTIQANNYSPNRKYPSDSPPSENSWLRRGIRDIIPGTPTKSWPLIGQIEVPFSKVCDTDSPLFSSLQPQLQESILQWVPKARVSAPPPPVREGYRLGPRTRPCPAGLSSPPPPPPSPPSSHLPHLHPNPLPRPPTWYCSKRAIKKKRGKCQPPAIISLAATRDGPV